MKQHVFFYDQRRFLSAENWGTLGVHHPPKRQAAQHLVEVRMLPRHRSHRYPDSSYIVRGCNQHGIGMVEASSIMFYNVYVVNHSNIIWVIFCFELHQPEDLEIETPDANNHFKQHHCIRMLIKHGSFTSEFHHVSHWGSGRQNQGMTAEPQGIWQLELLDFQGPMGDFHILGKKILDMKNTWKSHGSQQSTELLSFWSQMSSDFELRRDVIFWLHIIIQELPYGSYHHPRIARNCQKMSQYVPICPMLGAFTHKFTSTSQIGFWKNGDVDLSRSASSVRLPSWDLWDL